jgi:spore coat polysaccharide biosynthesis predicted glycosyltransferase SpsG
MVSFLKGLSVNPSWIVTDHYELSATWERAVRPYVERLAAFDDADGRRHECDLIINAALSPIKGRSWYRSLVSPRTTLLLGPRYALPDPLLAMRRRRSRDLKTVRSVCFFLGGGVSPATFRRYLQGVLASVPATVQRVMCIPPNGMKGAAKLSSDRRLSVVRDYARLSEVLGSVDLFVGSGGAISYDRTAAGVPGVVVSMAPNQVDLCRYLAKLGTQIYLGECRSISPVRLGKQVALLAEKINAVKSMASRCDGVVDGQGGERISKALRRACGPLRSTQELVV